MYFCSVSIYKIKVLLKSIFKGLLLVANSNCILDSLNLKYQTNVGVCYLYIHYLVLNVKFDLRRKKKQPRKVEYTNGESSVRTSLGLEICAFLEI